MRHRFVVSTLLGILLGAPNWGSSSALADWKDDIRYTKLASALGSALPRGAGVPVSQVEAGGLSTIYFPDTSFSELADVTFVDGSSLQTNGISTHATYVATNFYGNTSSVAPDVNTVTIYEAGRWLNLQLKAPSGGSPLTQSYRVQNHSWIGSFDTTPADPPNLTELNNDINTLRRYDYVINRDNITACVGLGNGTGALPRLLSQGFNSIGVGLTSGLHSLGLTDTVGYGPGRSKPELVLPFTTTSGATGGASSAATFLHSVPQVVGTNAAKNETMKAILMAGASKSEFPGWTRTISQPLDDTFGAGEVDVYNSYLITQGGQQAGSPSPGTPVGSYGWDYQSINAGVTNELNYRFHIPQGSFAKELSILLAWNVDVSPSFNSQTLVNLDLRLTDSLGQTIDQSISTVDNIEHLYLKNLAAGDYTLTVTNNDLTTSHAFGLAWRTATLFGTDSNNLAPSADFDDDGFITGSDFLAWQRGNGKLLNATHADGDADGDGDVDSDDRLVFLTQYNSLLGTAAVALAAVPEPSSVLLASGAVAAYFLARKRRVG
jgi:hypothetical protein